MDLSLPYRPPFTRMRSALCAALVHFALSIAVASAVAALLFGVWFPYPYRELAGGRELFWLIVSVDAVCGPLLTLVLFSPSKPRGELARDMALVAAIQLGALGYGLHTLALARPVALAFETDRFRAVTLADLDEADLPKALGWLNAWSWSGPRIVGTRRARNNDEFIKSLDLSLAGIEPGQRPSWWQDYQLNVPDVLKRAKPIADLAAKHPDQRALLDEALRQTGQPRETLRWLPLVSHRAMDWVALVDAKTAEVRGYAHLDGF